MQHDELEQTERDILDFEARDWTQAGAKDTAIRETLGWSPTRHNMVLRALLDRPAALQYAPAVVWRLRRHLQAARTLRQRQLP